MTHGSEDCLKCEEHKAWEERMKVLDRVPSLISWQNYMKGAMAVIIVLLTMAFPIMYNHIMTIRAETSASMDKQDRLLKEAKDQLSTQVAMLSQTASTISRDVAVFVAKSELKQEAIAGELSVVKSELKTVRR